MAEIWKPVALEQFSNRYDISNFGRIRSRWNGNILRGGEKFGYRRIRLSKDGVGRDIGVHTLVALTFLDNPEEHPIVNHKNGDKADNNVENLEWISMKGNAQHARATGLTKSRTIPVLQYSLNGETFVAEFTSMKEAQEKTRVSSRRICDSCRGKIPDAGGFTWKYKHEKDNIIIEAVECDGISVPEWPKYQVTKDGRIYSERSRRYLKPNPSASYSIVNFRDNGEVKAMLIHLVVAQVYIPNPANLPYVNHKNGNKRDNRVENLEWISKSGNMVHAIEILKVKRSAKAVVQFDKNHVYIKHHLSMKKAGTSAGLKPNLINGVCRNLKKSSGGFLWRYAADCQECPDGTWYILSKIKFLEG